MKRLVFFSLMALLGCTKEVAKKDYLLVLQFNNGIKSECMGRIYEKDKVYHQKNTNEIGDHVAMKYYPNSIFFYSNDGVQVYLFKTKEEKLVGTTTQLLHITNGSSALGVETGNIYGNIEFEGNYKSPFRKIKVEQGTFTFQWSNAADYGLNDTTLTGTWTLKRK